LSTIHLFLTTLQEAFKKLAEEVGPQKLRFTDCVGIRDGWQSKFEGCEGIFYLMTIKPLGEKKDEVYVVVPQKYDDPQAPEFINAINVRNNLCIIELFWE